MRLRTVGFGLTLAAVAVLLGSLVWGILGGGEAAEGGMEMPVSAGTSPGPAVDERIRVEVLNASDVSGLARRVTERLRRAGFDVVYYGNASGAVARDSTTLLQRNRNDAAVAAVAEELGVERIEQAPDTSLYLEVTVVLGSDWEE